jgi:hypothetical protein
MSFSLCNLCVLCASVVISRQYKPLRHRDTENTEGAQRSRPQGHEVSRCFR